MELVVTTKVMDGKNVRLVMVVGMSDIISSHVKINIKNNIKERSCVITIMECHAIRWETRAIIAFSNVEPIDIIDRTTTQTGVQLKLDNKVTINVPLRARSVLDCVDDGVTATPGSAVMTINMTDRYNCGLTVFGVNLVFENDDMINSVIVMDDGLVCVISLQNGSIIKLPYLVKRPLDITLSEM